MIAAAVRALPQPPSELLAVRLEGVELRVYPDQVAALVDEAAAESANHAAGRDRLRMKLVRAFYERYTQRLGVAAYHSFDDIEAALRTGGYLNRTLDALWPRPKPDQLVRRLLTQPEALAAAAEGILERGRAAAAPVVPRQGLVDADLPLLDEARALLEGPDRPHGHLIVDEAQDLTPMQLRMLRRRSAGAITILGDIAQSSGPISYTSWSDVARCLAPDMTLSVEELRLAYRVPADVMELALPLLPLIAPEVAAPIAYRSGDEPPRFVRTDAEHLVSTAVREAGAEALRDGRTALIAPAEILARDRAAPPWKRSARSTRWARRSRRSPRVPRRASSSTGSSWSSRRRSPPAGSRGYARSTSRLLGRRRHWLWFTRRRCRPSSGRPEHELELAAGVLADALDLREERHHERRPAARLEHVAALDAAEPLEGLPAAAHRVDVDPSRVGAGLEPEPAARLVARDPVLAVEVLLRRREVGEQRFDCVPSRAGYQRDRRPRRLV